MLLSPRWRGVQFHIYLLHLILHLLQPQPQLILPAHHIQHSTRRSTFMLVPGVMGAVCSLASTQASMDQRLTRAETTLEECHTMLLQIKSHLGLPHVPAHRDEPATAAAASVDVLTVATAATDPPPPHE